MSDKHHDKPGMIASRKLLDLAKVEYVQHEPKRRKFVIDFDSMRQVASDIPNSARILTDLD